MMSHISCLDFLFSGQHFLPWSFRNVGYNIPYCTTLRMIRAFKFCSLTMHSGLLQQPPVVTCVQFKGKEPISQCTNAHQEAKQRKEAKTKLNLSEQQSEGRLRSKIILADSRKRPWIDKNLANMDLSFQYRAVRQSQFFPVDNLFSLFCETICTSSTVWQLYRCKILSIAAHCQSFYDLALWTPKCPWQQSIQLIYQH